MLGWAYCFYTAAFGTCTMAPAPAGATEIMEIIGKEETLKRVKAAIEKLS